MSYLSDTKLDFLTQKCSLYVQRNITQGGVITIRHKGEEVYQNCFGRMTGEPDSPAMPYNAIFPLASISKTITATAIMILVEDGELDLGFTVPGYFPGACHESWNQITLGSLLTHSCGITGDGIWETVKTAWELENPGKDIRNEPLSREEYLRRGLKAPRLIAVDKAMSYLGFGYDVLAMIVEKVSGISFDDFTRQRIFMPLGMADTNIIVPDECVPRVVRRTPPAGEAEDYYSSSSSLKRVNGNGAAYSTSGDMAVFAQMILNGGIYKNTRLLSSTSVRMMTSNRIPGVSAIYGDEFFKEASWGFGFNRRGYKCDHEGILQTGKTFNHGGAGGVLMVADFDYDLAFTIFNVPLGGNIRPLCNNIIFTAIEGVPAYE